MRIALLCLVMVALPFSVVQSADKLPWGMQGPVKGAKKYYEGFKRKQEKGDVKGMKSNFEYFERNWEGIESGLEKKPGDYAEVEQVRAWRAEMRKALASGTKKAAAASAKREAGEAAAKAAYEKWMPKFAPYGSGNKSLDIWHGANSLRTYAKQAKLYAEVSALLQQWRKEGSPGREKLEGDSRFHSVSKAVVQYARYQAQSRERILAKVRRRIKRFESAFARGRAVPEKDVAAVRAEMKRIRSESREFGGLIPESALEEVEAELAVALEKNKARSDELMRKRKVSADGYRGGDAAAVKAAARKILAKKVTGKILRTAIVGDKWERHAEWKWTDTSRTATRYHVYRLLKVELAVEDGGQARLHYVYVHQDRDGGKWGGYYGNKTDYSHRILKANI